MTYFNFNRDWLNGTHILTGVGFGSLVRKDSLGYSEKVNTVLFTLDGKNYPAVENPDDGYRSYCEDIEECIEKPSNTFLDVEVIVKTINEPEGFADIEVLDILSQEVILRVGTDYSLDYYPCCRFDWYPENMYVNKQLRKIDFS